jgi:septum formation protein
MALTAESLILASASPIRKKLLAAAGITVRVEPALVDEEALKRIFQVDRQAAADCALALAEAKARQVAENYRHALVVGADQILVCGKIWLNRPTDLADARAQLQALRGRTHMLVTAVCVVREAARIWHTVSSAKLTMRHFSDAFLDAYLASEQGAVLGSVGGYRLEERGIQLFAEIHGDYFGILGLPLLELLSFLRARGALAA